MLVSSMTEVAVTCIVDEDVESTERVDGRLYGVEGGTFVRHVERDRADPIAVARDEVGESPGVPRRGDQAMTGCEHGVGESAAEATRASSDEPNLGHGFRPPAPDCSTQG